MFAFDKIVAIPLVSTLWKLLVFSVLISLTTSCHASVEQRKVTQTVAGTEAPLILSIPVKRPIESQPVYVILEVGKIWASEKSAPNIRIYFLAGNDPDKLEPGSPEHLGTLAIFPWPADKNRLPVSAIFNATNLIHRQFRNSSEATEELTLKFVVSVTSGEHSRQPAKVEVLSLRLASKDQKNN